MQQKTVRIAAWSAGHDNNARRWLESRKDAVAGRAKTYILFGSGRLSVRELDRVSATRPIVILHASVHLMNVNSAMLALAGIDEDTDIDGIHKDAEGQPTGELQEFAAMYPVQKVTGSALSLAAAEQREAIWKFGRVAQLAGVTTATDLVSDLSPQGLAALREVTGDAAYPLRIVPAFAPQRNPEGGAARGLTASMVFPGQKA